MKRALMIVTAILTAFFGMHHAGRNALALDAPHNSQKQAFTITCSSCHYDPASTPAWATLPTTTDNTIRNNLCKSCHSQSGMPAADPRFTKIATHSAFETQSSYRSGNWTVECTACHSPHNQYQTTLPAYNAMSSSNVVTGTLSAVSSNAAWTISSVTVSGPVLTPNAYVGYLLVPNTLHPTRIYRIRSNTTNVISVDGAIHTGFAKIGNTYAVRYGKLANNTLRTTGSGNREVRFFNATGPNSFATGTTPSTTSICQVCHTRTGSFKNDGTLEGPGHPPSVAGTNCTSCHTHEFGFRAGCDSCHGNPPVVTTLGGPSGLAQYDDLSGTGSTNAGKHQKHAVTLGYNCSACHTGYVMPENAAKRVDIGFSFGASQGTYSGQTTVSYQGRNGTVVSSSGAKTCSNIYCHSNAKTGTPVATYASVSWDPAAPAMNCSSCHAGTATGPAYTSGGAGAATANSHPRHVVSNSLGCQKCHNQTTTDGTTIRGDVSPGKHVNADTQDVFFDAQSPSGTYNKGSKSCSTTYCHGSGTPQWGSSIACGDCHAANNTLAGRHGTHYATGTTATSRNAANYSTPANYVYTCGVCHDGTPHGDGAANPPDRVAQVAFDAAISGGGAYSEGAAQGADPATSFNWTAGSCSSTYCHSQGTTAIAPYPAPNTTSFTWATTAGSFTCASCHNYTAASGSAMAGGSHTAHVNKGVLMTNKGCEACHVETTSNGTAIADRTKHVNKAKNVGIAGTYDSDANPVNNFAANACSNVYCHSSGQSATGGATPIYASPSPTWGGSAMTCSSCHKNMNTDATAPGSHPKHVLSSGILCSNCHSGYTASSVSAATHLDKLIYTGFSGTGAGTTYSQAGASAVGNGYGSCSTSSCHGAGTPTWGADTTNHTCTKCHGAGTATVNATNRYVVAPPKSVSGNTGTLTGVGQVSNDPKVGAHQTHLQLFNGLTSTAVQTLDERCLNCHGTLPTVGMHANGVSTPTWSGLATKSGAMTPSYAGTSCNNTYCHNPSASGGSLLAVNTGASVTPSWTDAAYLGDTLLTQANCGKCHKVPGDAGFEPAGTHSGMTIAATDCTGCHGHNGNTVGAAGQRHMDGIKYGAGQCDSCHGYQATSWATATERATEGKGAHAKHVAHLVMRWGGSLNPGSDQFGSGAAWTNVCGHCHNGATHSMGEAIGGTGREISILTSYQFGPSVPAYNGAIGVSSATTPKSCSNLSCHFKLTPVWSAY